MSSSLELSELVEEATEAPDGRRLGVLFWVCVGWLALNLLAAILANVLPLPNPLTQDYNAINAGPSLHHLFGTDDLGRDIFSRVVFGSRVSLVVGFSSVSFAIVVGTVLGLISGYAGGWVDNIIMRFMDVLLAFPSLLL